MCTPRIRIVSSLLLGGFAIVSGCTDGTVTSTPSSAPITNIVAPTSAPPAGAATVSATAKTEEHGHKAAAHGGILVSLGRDSYHVEAVFEKGGLLRLYTLGNDESRVIDIEKQTLKGFVKVDGDSQAAQFLLEPEPIDGDAPGRTSQFVGSIPEDLQGRNLEVTVPNIVISGERFRLGFKSTPEQHNEGMPAKIADDQEGQLYLTPGGMYTQDDIEANGNVTASVKFKGLASEHNMFPKAGDKICPITQTLANPTFTWIVGGKPYEFCCPPCVDEFVKLAKTSPEEIKEPNDYIKK
jgi:hypothetical protein